MKIYRVAAASLVMVACLVGASSATASDEPPSCEQLGAELTALTGSAMEVASNAAEQVNKKQSAPSSVGTALINQALGAALNAAPANSGGALAMAIGMIQKGQDKVRDRKAAQAERAVTEATGSVQMERLDRLLVLNEQYQANCPE